MATDAGPVEPSPSSPAREGAQAAARSTHLRHVASAGLLGYAAIHLLVGWLAWSLAWMQRSPARTGGRPTDSSGALALVAESPVGGALLWAIAVGMGGLCIWQAAEVLRHHRHLPPPGHRRSALVQLVKTVGTACLYGYLAWSAVRTALGHGTGSGQEKRTVSGVLGWPGGQVIVGIAGLIFIGVAFDQARKGYKKKFLEQSKTEEMDQRMRKTFTWAGVAGHIARGVVFALIGYFLVRAAIDYDPDKAVGLDGALATLGQSSYGPIVLGIVAAGLVCFATYSMFDARYRKV